MVHTATYIENCELIAKYMNDEFEFIDEWAEVHLVMDKLSKESSLANRLNNSIDWKNKPSTLTLEVWMTIVCDMIRVHLNQQAQQSATA